MTDSEDPKDPKDETPNGEYKKLLPRFKPLVKGPKRPFTREKSGKKSRSFSHYKRLTPQPETDARLRGLKPHSLYENGFEAIPPKYDQNLTTVFWSYHRTVLLSPALVAGGFRGVAIYDITGDYYDRAWVFYLNAGVSEDSIDKYRREVDKALKIFRAYGLTHPTLDAHLGRRLKERAPRPDTDPDILIHLGVQSDHVVKKRRTEKERALEEKKIRIGTRIQNTETGVTLRVGSMGFEKKRHGVKEKMVYWDPNPGPNWSGSKKSIMVRSVLSNLTRYKIFESA